MARCSLIVLVCLPKQDCHVTFTSIESLKAAYPMNVTGDVLDDLPPIGNFCMTESNDYL